MCLDMWLRFILRYIFDEIRNSFCNFKVEGVSMQPVLNPEEQSCSDYVFLSKWAVRNFEVERGDIVALGKSN